MNLFVGFATYFSRTVVLVYLIQGKEGALKVLRFVFGIISYFVIKNKLESFPPRKFL